MSDLQDKMLAKHGDVIAPDGSEVRLLCAGEKGSAAHFTLLPGQDEKIIRLVRGQSLIIPVGAEFQFRNTGDVAMTAFAVTMPPWPGEGEVVFVAGIWPANI